MIRDMLYYYGNIEIMSGECQVAHPYMNWLRCLASPHFCAVGPENVLPVRMFRFEVYRLKDSGKMPLLMKVSGMVRWRSEEIENWIANGCPELRARNPRRN